MGKKIFSLFSLLILLLQGIVVAVKSNQATKESAGNQVVIAVNNNSGIERQRETISLDWKTLTSRLPDLKPDYVLVTDHATGKQIVSQIVDNNGDGAIDELIFQTDFPLREPAKVFTIEVSNEKVPTPESKTYGRYVPERSDDFAWENDRVAFRMYGKNLETSLVSSGIDLWAKRVRYSIINQWFKEGDAYYHKDNGTGLDMYSVKKSRGCGGSGIWDGKTLHVSRNYKSWKVIANGPIRTVFELSYEPWDVNGVAVSEVKRITLDAGQNLSKIESAYKAGGKIPKFEVGVGIARHEPDWQGTFDSSKEKGWMSRWEDSKTNGNLGCGVVAEPNKIVSMFDEQGVTDTATEYPHHYFILSADTNKTTTYYTGGGWDRSGDFADKKSWNAYLDNFSKRLQSPLKISFLREVPKEKSKLKVWSKVVADSFIAKYPESKKFGPYPRWHYDNGFYLSSLLELYKRDKNTKYLQYVKSWVDSFVSEDGTIDCEAIKNKDYELDSLLPGRLLISLYQLTKDEKYKKAAFKLAEELKEQPRTSDGGYWHKKVYANQMWLDGIYMAGTYSVDFANAFNQPQLFDETAKQITLIHSHTHDPKTGLLVHGWDETKSLVWANPQTGASPEFWGRAIGWYMMALVDELDYLPKNHPKRDEIVKILQNLSASLVKYQDTKTGLWYQVIDKGDRADNWHETSATAMFVYALAKGARKGYLSSAYKTNAQKAYQGLLDNHVYLDESDRFYFTGTVIVGTLNIRVSKGDYDYYVSTPRFANDIKGVAAFFWASLEMEKVKN